MSTFLPWKILHVAVREALTDLVAETRWGGCLLVFWCDAVPVGQMSIPAALLPLSSSQLAQVIAPRIVSAVMNRLWQLPSLPASLAGLLELERPLDACSHAIQGGAGGQPAVDPSVSVVICTKNRPESLAKCLSSIRGLSPPPSEIVVVDNDPSSGLTQPVTATFSDVRYIPEPRPGSSTARNTGVRHCSSEVIAFTDDDAIVHHSWVGVIRGVFADSNIIAFAGLVLPAELSTPAQFVRQGECRWDFCASDFNQRSLHSWSLAGAPTRRMDAGANMAFRREAFERVGCFDERLGDGAADSSEDTDLWYRLLAEGHRCRYEPAAVVFGSHRAGWDELSDQTFRHMRGDVAALLFQFDRYKRWENLYEVFLALPFRFLTLAFGAFKRTVMTEDQGKNSFVRPLTPQIRGAIAGCGEYLRHRWRQACLGNHRGAGT